LFDVGSEPIGTSDHEYNDRTPAIPPGAKLSRHGAAIETMPMFIERNNDSIVWDNGCQRDRFFQHAFVALAGAAFSDLDDFHVADADLATGIGGPLSVAFGELPFRPGFEPADGSYEKPHGCTDGFRVSVQSPRGSCGD